MQQTSNESNNVQKVSILLLSAPNSLRKVVYLPMVKLFFITLASMCLTSCGGGPSASDKNSIEQASSTHANGASNETPAFGLSYPGVTETADRGFTLSNLQTLSLSRVRFDEDWKHREPVEGEFNWAPLDDRMQWLADNEISVLLTIQSNGPNWACEPDLSNERTCIYSNTDKFENYIQTLLQRYPNQIEQLQFGNEWLSPYWFLGSANDFVEYNNIVYRSVQRHSPNTKVVLGGFASGSLSIISYCAGDLDQFFDEQSGDLVDTSRRHNVCNSEDMLSSQHMLDTVLESAEFDYLDLHLYDDVENWGTYLQTMRNAVGDSVPVIIGEFGGPNLIWEQPYSDEFQATRLALYLDTLSAMDINEAYYFKLVQSESALAAHWESGLYKLEGDVHIKKPAFDVFEHFMENYSK